MKVGDVIINPWVNEYYFGDKNPMYKTMVISIGSDWVKTLRYDGKLCTYPVKDAKTWKVSHHVDIYDMIFSIDSKSKKE